ncbi:MAG: hypothetical protein ACAH80_16110 [Alphaproteobacteria bacterium]
MQENETAPEKPSLSAAFNAVAQEAVADYPALAGRFILVDLQEGQIHGIPNLMVTKFRSVEEVEKYLNDKAQKAIEQNTSNSVYDGTRGGLGVIFYNGDAQQPIFGTSDVENALGVIDHELGHILIPGGMDSTTPDASIKSENKADLFSALRKARRDGEDDIAGTRLLAFTRARALILSGNEETQEHFTTFSLMKLAEMMRTTPMHKLQPQMAVGMAEMLGDQYSPSAERVKALAEAFTPCRGMDPRLGAEGVARNIASVTTAPDASDDVFKLGSFVMSFYLNGQIRVHGKPLKLEGAFWDDVREKIAAREAQPKAPAGLILFASGASNGPS